jgi:MscS family membrane protein
MLVSNQEPAAVASFEEFWNIVVEVWQTGFLGIDIGRGLTALGIFALFMIFRGLFARLVLANIERLTRKSQTTMDDAIVAALKDPVRFVPVVVGAFFALNSLGLQPALVEISGNLVRSLVAFNIFWALYRVIGPVSVLMHKLNNMLGEVMVDWLIKAIRGLTIFVGGATILELWGIQVGPLLAGLGLFGVAVALGAQDLFKNLIAGVLILVEKRFKKGDWIMVDGVVEGVVENISFRSTLIRRFDKAPVFVPNAAMSDNAVTNFSEMTHRRIYWKIGVEYSTSVDQLRQIRDRIEAYILGNDEFAQPPEVSTFVRVDSFNDSSIDYMVYCFTRTTNWGEWLEIKERLAYAVKEIVLDAGSDFAFPSQTLYIDGYAGDQPEAFVPPTE